MTDTDKKQLEHEIRQIFESGENELRIFNMVVDFIDKRYVPKDNGASLFAICKKCGSFIFTKDGKQCVLCHEPCQ
jgi:hypothetical protein